MSDEEEEMQEEEEAEAEEAPKEEEKPKPKPPPPRRVEEDEVKEMSEAEKALIAQRKRHEEEEALKLKDYEEQRRIEKQKEEEELRQLKEKQERRRQEREEEERIMNERRKEEEDRRKQEEEARKAKAEADKARKEEEKKKKAAMMAGLQQHGASLVVEKRKHEGAEKGQIVKKEQKAKESKEQHEANKADTLRRLCGELVCNADIAGLRNQVRAMHQRICKLEAARYDLEKRYERQDYDMKELNDRQRQMQRNQALKKGLDPDEAASSVHPPKILTASKYDRQIDRRSYGDRRDLYAKDKTPKAKSLFHGSARPPNEWGRHENEELEQIRKNMEPPKYVEAVKVEGAKPPMTPVPSQMPAAEEAEAPAE